VIDHFSDFLVFADESGDHGLESIDSGYPLFVLAFCVISKVDYVAKIVPALQSFKLGHFGHDNVVLHERDIRKDVGAFAFLKTPQKKIDFLNELTRIVSDAPFTLICSVIRKEALKKKYSTPANPYHIALGFGLERVHGYLQAHGAGDARTHVIVERRGKREDGELELEFRRVCSGANYRGEKLPLDIEFADKKANLPGLQLADLVARPVGMSILRPDQTNRSFEAVRGKLYTNSRGAYLGWGLKCFP
jgi:hypothetical protein